MDTRETVTFDSGTHTVVAYTFITAGEARVAKEALFRGVDMEADPSGIQARPKIPLANTIAYERAQIDRCLVTIDGKPAVEVLDNLPSDEYDTLIADVRKN